MVQAMQQQELSETVAALSGGYAKLSNVRDIVGDTGAEHHADQSAVVSVSQYPGFVRVEDATAGEADDVVKETQRAVQGTVLVVYLRVDVSDVGVVNELCRSLVVVGGPWEEVDVGR